MVELYRLGKNLDNHPVEIPDAYLKYLSFYAMAKALERPGHGQDMDRSQHYQDRFEMGVARMIKRRQGLSQEYVGKFDAGDGEHLSFGIGDPQVPPLNNWSMEL
jgi:hypothetical protein